jgi:hypothetical protein
MGPGGGGQPAEPRETPGRAKCPAGGRAADEGTTTCCGAGWQPAAGCLTRLQTVSNADERRLPTGAQDTIPPHKRLHHWGERTSCAVLLNH